MRKNLILIVLFADILLLLGACCCSNCRYSIDKSLLEKNLNNKSDPELVLRVFLEALKARDYKKAFELKAKKGIGNLELFKNPEQLSASLERIPENDLKDFLACLKIDKKNSDVFPKNNPTYAVGSLDFRKRYYVFWCVTIPEIAFILSRDTIDDEWKIDVEELFKELNEKYNAYQAEQKSQ